MNDNMNTPPNNVVNLGKFKREKEKKARDKAFNARTDIPASTKAGIALMKSEKQLKDDIKEMRDQLMSYRILVSLPTSVAQSSDISIRRTQEKFLACLIADIEDMDDVLREKMMAMSGWPIITQLEDDPHSYKAKVQLQGPSKPHIYHISLEREGTFRDLIAEYFGLKRDEET